MKRSSSIIIIKHPPQKGKRTETPNTKRERKKKEGKTGTL